MLGRIRLFYLHGGMGFRNFAVPLHVVHSRQIPYQHVGEHLQDRRKRSRLKKTLFVKLVKEERNGKPLNQLLLLFFPGTNNMLYLCGTVRTIENSFPRILPIQSNESREICVLTFQGNCVLPPSSHFFISIMCGSG